MELNEALLQISAIRHQMARTEQFRGYRAAPVAASGLLAFVAGAVQASLIDSPMRQLGSFLTLWVCVAVVSQSICFADIWRRYKRSSGLLHQETTHLALAQFCPCLVAGALLTFVVVRSVPESAGMLPGLWAVLFSMGLFASWRLLPKAIFGVACYYLVSGLLAVALAGGQFALSPWIMPLLFGVGQTLTAAVLFLSERQTDRSAE
jgi:hypothetical protein